MRDPDDASRTEGTGGMNRRRVLQTLGATCAGMVTMAGSASAGCTGGKGGKGDDGGDDTDYSDIETPYVMRQGDNCTPLVAFSGGQTVEEFYQYEVAPRYASSENGGFGVDDPTYSSVGTQSLQRDNESIVFLYDGPDGLSLVVVHGSLSGSPDNGGSATFDISGLPSGGSWAVKDDLYRNDEGELADTNYDRWDPSNGSATIDWTWRGDRTDGGAFRGLGSEFSITIDPAFNEDAALFGDQYSGTVDSWVFLTPDGHRMSMDMSSPLTIESGSCNETEEVDFEIVEPKKKKKEKDQEPDFDVNSDYSDDREYSTDHHMFDASGERKKMSNNCKADSKDDGNQTAMEKWYSRTNANAPANCDDEKDTTMTAMERWFKRFTR